MQFDDLIAQLRLSASGDRKRTAACPDDHLIAAYVDGSVDATNRAMVEQHLADCEACAHVVGVLSRSRDAASPETVPELLLARARKLRRASPSNWSRYVPLMSAAAIAAVSVSVLLNFLQEPQPTVSREPEIRETRATTVAQSVLVLAPAAGATIVADELVFRWAPVAGSSHYDVRIVTDAGVLVGEQRINATEWRPSADIGLVPGADYFVRVDAYRSDSRAISSSHIPFSVSPQP